MLPLDEATISDMELLELALSEGADPNSKGPRGETPVHLAAKIGSVSAIELLLAHGALPDTLDEFGDSPLMKAVEYDDVESARMLLAAGARMAYRFSPDPAAAAQIEVFDMITTSIRARKDNPPAFYKNLPEDLAAELNSEKNLEEMVAYSRQIHLMEKGKHAISECHGLEMLVMLVDEFHADPNHVDDCGYWPLRTFAEADDLSAIQWLLRRDVKVDQTSTGETALFAAVRNDNLEMVRLLIAAGANVNQQDVDRCVPFHCCRSVAIAELLFEAGADPTIPDQCDFPSWHFVKEPETRRFIQEAANRKRRS